MPPPPDAKEPSPRWAGRPDRVRDGAGAAAIPIEPLRRRARIESRRQARAVVFAHVVKHIDEAKAHLPRGAERACMVAIGDDASAVPSRTVHRASDANPERARTVGERGLVRRLDEEVNVVVLYGEVNDAVVVAVGGAEGGRDRGECLEATKRWNTLRDAQRDVHWMCRDVGQPRDVG